MKIHTLKLHGTNSVQHLKMENSLQHLKMEHSVLNPKYDSL